MGFSIFPLRISQVGKWQSQKVDLSQRPVSLVEVEVEGRYLVMVARLGSSLENSSPDFPPWRQSWVTGQLGPLVILVLSWSSQPAQPGPGQDTSVRQSGPWQSSTQPHLTSPVTHSNTPTLHTETDQLLRGNLVDWEFTYPFTLTWYFWSLISGH